MFEIDYMILLTSTLSFGILLILLSKFAFPSIFEAMEKRRKEIDHSIQLARKSQEEAQSALNEYRNKINEANQAADKILDVARKESEQEKAALIDRAKKEAQLLVDEAKIGMKMEKERLADELRKDAADLVTRAAAKVIERALTGADDARIIKESIDEIKKA
jgi:F-type H+-transporting ATPase subunit b